MTDQVVRRTFCSPAVVSYTVFVKSCHVIRGRGTSNLRHLRARQRETRVNRSRVRFFLLRLLRHLHRRVRIIWPPEPMPTCESARERRYKRACARAPRTRARGADGMQQHALYITRTSLNRTGRAGRDVRAPARATGVDQSAFPLSLVSHSLTYSTYTVTCNTYAAPALLEEFAPAGPPTK